VRNMYALTHIHVYLPVRGATVNMLSNYPKKWAMVVTP